MSSSRTTPRPRALPCCVEPIPRGSSGDPSGPRSSRGLAKRPQNALREPLRGSLIAFYPQPWTGLGTVTDRGRRGEHAVPHGDHGRLVEKLSPGMCTAWGDLVPGRSLEVTAPGRGSPPAVNRSPWAEKPAQASHLHVSPAGDPGRAVRGPTSDGRPGIAGDIPGRHRGQRVDERPDRCTSVEMSTCRHREAPDHPQPAHKAIRALSSRKRLDPQVPHV